MLISFDLDGVLMKNPFGKGVFPYVKKLIAQESKQEEQAVMDAIIKESKTRLLQGEYKNAYNWDDIVSVVAKQFGCDFHIDIASLVESYCYEPYIGLYPNVVETLAKLKVPKISITNGFRKYQVPVLKALGILDYFTEVYSPDVTGYTKPQKEAYLAAYGNETHCFHVGDTLIHDVWGANQAGATTIWYYPALPEQFTGKLPNPPKLSEFEEVLRVAMGKDLCAEAYSQVTLAGAMPDYIITDISQLLDIVDLEGIKTS